MPGLLFALETDDKDDFIICHVFCSNCFMLARRFRNLIHCYKWLLKSNCYVQAVSSSLFYTTIVRLFAEFMFAEHSVV